VGTTSAAQSVTVTNSGGSTLTFSGITVSTNFAETNTCTSSLAAGGSCTINVTFTAPATTGTVTGILTITDNASNSPQTVSLTGTAAPPAPQVTTPAGTSTISFPTETPGSTSTSQTATVTNTSSSVALTITGIAVSANFSQSNNCPLSPSTLGASASCAISVAFTPPANTVGTLTGTLTINDNAPNSPQQIALTGTSTGPVVTLSAPSLTFSAQTLNTPSTAQSVLVTNSGNANLTISSVVVTGTNSGDFAQTNTCGSPVAANGTCMISVTFTPTAEGTRTASVSITDNATATSPQMVSLTGTGSAPEVSASPASLSFGSQNITTTSAAQTVTLTNSGNASLTITSIVVTAGSGTNPTPGDFALTNNTCGASVAASGTCTFGVTFTPAAAGTATASVTITDNSNDVASSTQTVSLTGTGTGAAVTFSPPSPYNFGSQTVGTSSSPATITVTNSGNATLTVTNFTATNSSNFTQTNNCSNTLAAGASCTFNVTFTPTAVGLQTATGTFTDNAPGSPQSYTVEGTGVSGISFSSPSLTFSATNVGATSAAQTTTLTNIGTTSFTISSISITGPLGSNPGDFSETNTCPVGGSLAAGASCPISVSFTPTASGSRTASVSVVDSLGTQTVALTGTGNGPAVSLSTTSINFGNQGVGQASAAQTVTLTNSGNTSLTITNIVVTSGTGSNPTPGDFALTNNTCGTPVAASGTCTFGVTFTPAAAGAVTASVTITDNANNAAGTTQSVSLSGTGGAGVASVSPSSLTFSSQSVDTTSAAQNVTLTNTGNLALSISGISFTGADPGDFGETSTCGNSVAASASCTISVTFEPTAAGTRTASLTLTDNSGNVAGSTQNVTLTGTGVAASVTLSSTTLTFANTTVGSSSTSQAVTLTNGSGATLTISSIAASANFSQTNNCPLTPSTLAASGTCTINVTFAPTTTGSLTGTLTITDSAPNSPQTVSLSGMGSVNNTAPLTVNLGAAGDVPNSVSTTVTVCVPNTTTCTTIPDVLVDTGSAGLRLLSSGAINVTGAQVGSLGLPQVTDPATGFPVWECVVYGDLSYTWGTLNMATVQVSGETGSQIPASAGGTANAGIPIQVISTATPPEGIIYEGAAYYNPCTYYETSTGAEEPTNGANDSTVATAGWNGILGVGRSPQDCSFGDVNYCTSLSTTSGQYLEYDSAGVSYEGSTFYYVVEPSPLNLQVWNPVSTLPVDNNGVELAFPSSTSPVGATGAASLTGTLYFGIGTESNNAIPASATTYGMNCESDLYEATFNGVNYFDVDNESDCAAENTVVIDSGSSILFFLDPTALTAAFPGVTFATCESGSGFYCPSSTLNLTGNLGLTLYGYNPAGAGGPGTPGTVSLSIADADTLFTANPSYTVFSNLAGPSIASGESPLDDSIDLGLPFFFNQPNGGIFVGISGTSSTYPNGYWAF
jgi:hypothetical protein